MAEQIIEVGEPFGYTPAVRTWDKAEIQIDWHDFLVNLWQPGQYYQLGARFRPLREDATGFEYECTIAGTTAGSKPKLPKTLGDSVTSGSCVFTARAISDASLRATIVTSEWVAPDPIVILGSSNDNFTFTAVAGGWVDGQEYEMRHRIQLTNGAWKEGVAIVPVRDEET